ncbi:hypothetical protein DFR52_10346 [Hoeflea marina]|uniref:Uncharacterized protein n=1 Tax=Hoeflea marina TaxID=274592 RepID=A0A317PIL9_9HYPH|nr:hypothetical protein [Hoeflea marina]PWV99849.1 hypothetical protein DFR52_10346 [Hoeflea marina]
MSLKRLVCAIALALSIVPSAEAQSATSKLPDVSILEGQALIEAIYEANMMPEGLWKGDLLDCHVSIDWSGDIGARSARIFTYNGKPTDRGFGFSDFVLSAKPGYTVEADVGAKGVTLKRNGTARSDFQHRLLYIFNFGSATGVTLKYLQVFSGTKPGTDEPPVLQVCTSLVKVSDEPAVAPAQSEENGVHHVGDWTYTLGATGEFSEAKSSEIDGATLQFMCNGTSQVASFEIRDGSYPASMENYKSLHLYIDNGKKAVFSLISAGKLSDAFSVGVGKTTALEFARLWSTASRIDVGVTDNPENALQLRRRFSGRGSQAAIKKVMAQCGLS